MVTKRKLRFVCAFSSTMSTPTDSQPLCPANAADPAVARTLLRTRAAHDSGATLPPQDDASAPTAPLRDDVFVWRTT